MKRFIQIDILHFGLKMVFYGCILLLFSEASSQGNLSIPNLPPYQNTSLSFSERARDLVGRMTLEQKVSQMQHSSPAIENLGIPAYNWWNECLHGVARNGLATVFPQAIGMAATWNPDLIQTEAEIISTEARAKYYQALEKGSTDIYQGLTFWSPNINIFRDPRWGRGQETYGEDPFLTGEIGKAFVRGLQGNDPRYLKVIATAKHFTVHSGPEPSRHSFDAWTSHRDLFDTYLPAFEALVIEAKVQSVMSAYNRIYGTPASASTFLLDEILRKKWGFKGYVVSDCWAISDIYGFHKYVPTVEKAAALSLIAGTDLSCGPEHGALIKGLELGYISENDIDNALCRLFEARFRLGMFDPPEMVPYSKIQKTAVDLPEFREKSLEVARQSIVLLKNKDKLLPLRGKYNTIAVIGSYAGDTSVLLGNYNGSPSYMVTLLEGIKNKAGKKVKVLYEQGIFTPDTEISKTEAEIAELSEQALETAKKADIVIFCGGISPILEGEELNLKIDGFSGGDRTHLDLPRSQTDILKKLKALGKKIVLVLTNGSALSINWEDKNIDAIVEAWYPGQEGGNAVADVLFGVYNPAGRLPVTFYKSVDDLPEFEDYSMKGRTYRYFQGEVLYPFGYGLSYSDFEYSDLKIVIKKDKDYFLQLNFSIRNTGKHDGDEVAQVYLKHVDSFSDQPIKSLIGLKRTSIVKGEKKEITIKIPLKKLQHYEPDSDDYTIAKGEYMILIGSSSDDIRLEKPVYIQLK